MGRAERPPSSSQRSGQCDVILLSSAANVSHSSACAYARAEVCAHVSNRIRYPTLTQAMYHSTTVTDAPRTSQSGMSSTFWTCGVMLWRPIEHASGRKCGGIAGQGQLHNLQTKSLHCPVIWPRAELGWPAAGHRPQLMLTRQLQSTNCNIHLTSVERRALASVTSRERGQKNNLGALSFVRQPGERSIIIRPCSVQSLV